MSSSLELVPPSPTPSRRVQLTLPSLPDDPSHPTQIALRTYALAISLSLTPSLLPFITALFTPPSKRSSRANWNSFKEVLKRDLGLDGFAFSITLGIGGGAALQHLWNTWDESSEWPWSRLNTNTETDSTKPRVSSSGLLHKIAKLSQKLTPTQKTFISNLFSSSLAIALLQRGITRRLQRCASVNLIPDAPPHTRTSPTLDLTLLLLVRAVDSLVQTFVFRRSSSNLVFPKPHSDGAHANQGVAAVKLGEELRKLERAKYKKEEGLRRQRLTTRIDALVFWACSARIMWCFFYAPERLPRSYVKWINTLANVDSRVIQALRAIREKNWIYGSPASPPYLHVLTSFAKDLGYPEAWGDPTVMPVYGGRNANTVWEQLGVSNRRGVGGIPCELVHGRICEKMGLGGWLNGSCLVDAGVRAVFAFLEAVAIYLPVHFLPILATRPRTLLKATTLTSTALASLRSAAFLSTFVSSYFLTVCFTRTLVLARLFPFVSHNFWDGPYGCLMAGCLMCGSSIWIENGRRRGEMALYVLPRALRACLSETWVRRGNPGFRLVERLTFILSLTSLLTAATHRPDSLRGLSRWTLAFIMKGPNAGFWKRKRRSPSVPMTPSVPPTPVDAVGGPAS